MSFRSELYRLARILGWLEAIAKGPRAIYRRIIRVAGYRGFGKIMRKFVLLLSLITLGCSTLQHFTSPYDEQREFEYYQKTGEIRPDPLLESTRFYLEWDCLENCAEGKLCEDCEK